MEGGPPGFGRSFTCSALLGILVGPVGLSAMGLSPAAAQLSSCVRLAFPVPWPSPATPGSKLPGLGSCAFARHYLRNVVLISSPSGTEMFHFPECRFPGLCIHPGMAADEGGRVAPFGNLRIKAR